MNQKGFTLVELMIVIAIFGVLMAVAIPSYQSYKIRVHRVEMMNELQNIARQFESRKLSMGRAKYSEVSTSGLTGNYPKTGDVLYTVSLETPEKGNWKFIATPNSSSTQAKDGNLSLSYDGQKCRGEKCGAGEEWNDKD